MKLRVRPLVFQATAGSQEICLQVSPDHVAQYPLLGDLRTTEMRSSLQRPKETEGTELKSITVNIN